VYRLACDVGVAGRVRNESGRVVIEAFAPERTLDMFVAKLYETPLPAASIAELRWTPIPPETPQGFTIVPSETAAEQRISIPPDLGICAACLHEIFDVHDRRHGYAFTNCTECGPRFTILEDLPYDRPATTMAGFAMCDACRREYEAPANRRFHAQPNACSVCGPQVALLGCDGAPLHDSDPIHQAGVMLARGEIVAVKGVGGFHLACDATSQVAVARLRARKQREEKPLAVMVASLEQAEKLARLREPERRLLGSPERPIVLCERRPGAQLAPAIAPHNPLVGLLLAYSPLHHLLLAEAGRPLVMTSGNLTNEPIVSRNEDAIAKLGPIADGLLVHDRPIAAPCDDSVACLIGNRPVLLRRARGYVPRQVMLPRALSWPVLAVGAQLKNAVCVATGDAAYLGPHVGDLDSIDTYRGFERSIDRLERMLRLHADVVAHDLHPDYLSTHYAQTRTGARLVPVQHHHAHIAAVMGEHRLRGPVLGIAFDGSGVGPDGTAWGGELMLCDFTGYLRIATLRPIPLAGGERAIREVWRLALAVLDEAFEGTAPVDVLPVFRGIDPQKITAVRQLIAHRLNSPLAHGAGRWFDALGAIAMGRAHSAFEGQIPLEWSSQCDVDSSVRYPFEIDDGEEPWQLDLRPAVRALVADLLLGRPVSVLAARFHETLAAGTATLVRKAAAKYGRFPIALGGGCFQNARLTESLSRHLESQFAMHRGREIPPGDGGLAFGQALVAGYLSQSVR
jgi:hydrogenase maturation protein HypF